MKRYIIIGLVIGWALGWGISRIPFWLSFAAGLLAGYFIW